MENCENLRKMDFFAIFPLYIEVPVPYDGDDSRTVNAFGTL